MAGQAAKKIKERNSRIISELNFYHLIVIVLTVTLNILVARNYYGFVVINIVHVLLLMHLKKLASEGTDLAGPGLLSYYFDIIYIGWFVLITSCFSQSIVI
jgi:hypothetical protein